MWLLTAAASAADLGAHASIGAGVPRGTLGAGPTLSVGVGRRSERADGRLQARLDTAWLRSLGEVEVETWTASLTHHQVRGTLALEARALELDAPVSPYLALGPAVGWTWTRVDDRVVESGPRLGAHAALGLEVVAGPGHVRLAVQTDALRADELLGPSWLAVLTPTLGYRL